MAVLNCTHRKGTHYCGGALYCLDTFSRQEAPKTIRRIEVASQYTIRNYCCIECGRRYKSVEVLNPVAYKIRPMPKSHSIKLGIPEEMSK